MFSCLFEAKLLRKASFLRSASHLGTIGGDHDGGNLGPIESRHLKPVGLLGCGGFGKVERLGIRSFGKSF